MTSMVSLDKIKRAVDAGRMVCHAALIFPVEKIGDDYCVTGLANGMVISISKVPVSLFFIIDEHVINETENI